MKKSILIVTLVALLLFVFPLAASATPPTPDAEDGWVEIVSDFAEQVTSWFTEVFETSTGPGNVNTLHLSILQDEEYQAQRLNALLQAIRYNILSD